MTPKKDGALTSLLERITYFLESTNTPYRVIDHPPIDGTTSGSSTVSGTRPEQGAKALMMIGGKKPIMVVVRGPDRVNYKAIRGITETADVRLASLEEVAKITLAEVGTLPPFGDLFGLTTYADRRLLAEGEIAFGTGLRTKTMVISTDDFRRIGNPIVDDFVKE